ncbi:matrix protein [Joa yellow blotch virus]|uniref:Matrix protein n=1 Tax=joa yellow blotch associated virus TaxID=3070922 RepID=A0AAE7UV92_9RHAB|nr:matrix protein [Joa yellow blotch virus]QUI75404.1 matrix protein [joa yellow blotch associated virus]
MIPILGNKRITRREQYTVDDKGGIILCQESSGILMSLNYIITLHVYDEALDEDITQHGISYPELFKYVEDNIGLPLTNPEAIKSKPDLPNHQIKELITLAKLHSMHTKTKITSFTQKTDFSDTTPTFHLKVGESIVNGGYDPHVVEVVYKDTEPLQPGEYQLNMKRQYKGNSDRILCEVDFALFVRSPPRGNNHVSSRLNLTILISKYASEIKRAASDPFRGLLKRKADSAAASRTPDNKRALIPSMFKMLSPS